jgi:hypothetical protein
MSISQSQIVDLLFKQAYGVTKTDNSTNKSPSNESIPSPLLIRADTMWVQSGNIPGIAASVSGLIQAYTGSSAVECVADTTTVPISGVYPTWKTNLTYWIPQEFGATYAVKVYVDNPGASNPTVTGTQIFAAGAAGIGEFYFNYQSGVLNFIGETIPPSLTSSKVIYIVGYRYVGAVGAANQTSFSSITVGPGSVNFSGAANVNLGNVSTLSITGGSNGQFLQTDGNGNLTWADAGEALPIASANTLGGIKVGSTLSIDGGGVLDVNSAGFITTSGGTISGNLTFTSGGTVTGLPTPVNNSDAATKQYVDDAITGLSWKQAVVALSNTNITISNPGTSTIGGATLVSGDRVLLIGQSTSSENGIYLFNGSTSALTRTTDANTPTELNGAAVFIQSGTYGSQAYTQTAILTTSFAGQVWVLFGASTVYTAGSGLELSGTTFNVLQGQGLLINGSNQLELDIQANTALQFSGEQLTLTLVGGGGLEQTSSGLKIAAGGVTNAMLANSGILVGASSGNSVYTNLGKSLDITGNTTQGISTTVSSTANGTVISIIANNASTTQKGVASFSANNFSVVDGVVSITSSSTSSGGTGRTYLEPTQILYGDGSNPVGLSSNFTYDPATNKFTVGGDNPVQIDGDSATIQTTTANGNLTISPNGTGSVIFGSIGNAVLETDPGSNLTLKANTAQVTIESGSGDIVMKLNGTTGSKVSISGVSALDYSTNLTSNDLVNKEYVDRQFFLLNGGTF